MKKILFVFMVLNSLAAASCAEDDSSIPNLTEKYAGHWSGSYKGIDKGTWQATINTDGEVNGFIVSTTLNTTYIIKGSVDARGSLNATYAATGQTVGSFRGEITETLGSGIWKNVQGTTEGTWSGLKDKSN